MIIFSSAVAGSGREDLELKVKEMAEKEGKTIEIINLVDEMVKSANKTNPHITPKNLPNLDIEKIKILKDHAITEIKSRIEKKPDVDYIIDGHLSFWWRQGPMNLLGAEDIRLLNPDFLISVVNDPNSIKNNLLNRKSWEDKLVDEYEIALWSELELYTADLIANTIGIKNYVIGAKENPITLFELIYKRDKPKAYISFTMAHRQGGYEKLDEFIKRVREYVILFDPRSVDIDAYVYGDKDERLKNLIFNQTVRRDFHFIDQSDIVIVYLNELVYSSGVDSERMHAHLTGKEVLLYFPFEKYSPFTPYFADYMFRNEDEILEKIRSIAERYRKQIATQS